MSDHRPAPGSILARVAASGPPLELSDWALSPAALERVLERVAAGARRIVECGSGVSTIAIARLLRELGAGHLWSLEHDPTWAERGRERLAAEGLAELATLIEAPLRPHPIAVARCGWYDSAALKQLPAAGVDLLLVDGPPAPEDRPEDERSRYPALPLLAGRLAPGATIMLDDAERAGERWALERWSEDLQIPFQRHPEGVAVATAAPTAGRFEEPKSRRTGPPER